MEKLATPYSAKGYVPKKKKEIPTGDRSIHEYIVMVTESDAQVASVIQSLTRATKERKCSLNLCQSYLTCQYFMRRSTLSMIHYRRTQ